MTTCSVCGGVNGFHCSTCTHTFTGTWGAVAGGGVVGGTTYTWPPPAPRLAEGDVERIAQRVVQLLTHTSGQKFSHVVGPEPTNGGLYACSCGIRHMSLEQSEQHRNRVSHATVASTDPCLACGHAQNLHSTGTGCIIGPNQGQPKCPCRCQP